MKIVIDIPKKLFDEIQKSNFITVGQGYAKKLIDYIKKGAPLEQEPKTGRWIPTGYDGYADGNPVYDWWECSECGWEHTGDEETLTPYCPNCGAKME